MRDIYQLRHTSPHIVWFFGFFIIDMFLSIMFNHVQLLYITYIYNVSFYIVLNHVIYICLRQVRCDVSLSIPHLKAAGMPPSRPQGDRSHSCAACRSRQFTFSMLDKSWKMRQGHAGPMLATGDGCLKMLDA